MNCLQDYFAYLITGILIHLSISGFGQDVQIYTKIEAEHFDDTGDYELELRTNASNDTVLKAASSSAFSSARFFFSGPPAVYNLIITYLDESDGASIFRCFTGEILLDSWVADESIGGDFFLSHTIHCVALQPGQEIKLESKRHSGANGRIDYIEIETDSAEFDSSAIYQAEEAPWHNGIIDTDMAGYTGDGYTVFNKGDKSGIQLDITADSSTYYSLKIRYSTASMDVRPVVVKLNNHPDDSLLIDFFYTGGDQIWQEQVITLSLDSGINPLLITASSENGLPNIDRLKRIKAYPGDHMPGTPRLLSPAEGDIFDSSFELHWLGVEQALSYNVYFAKGDSLSNNDLIVSTSQTFYPLYDLPDDDYIWAVEAVNNAGSQKSESGSFSVRSVRETYFIAVDGEDTNEGDYYNPFKTLSRALEIAQPGDTIYLRGGTYLSIGNREISNNGAENKLIQIFNWMDEKPVFELSSVSGRGLTISGGYIHLKGIRIQNAGDNGIYISGNNNIIERCETTGNEDTGIHLTDGASGNTIINCDSYRNFDPQNNGENADGFSAKFDVGPGNKFIGCRGYENSDDGWDLWEATESVIIEKCWAFSNGFNFWGVTDFAGDGNGFKLGGNYIPGPHTVRECIAFYNKKKGFDQNHNTGAHTLYNNTAYMNMDRNFVIYEAPVEGQHVLINNISYKASNNLDPTSVQMTNSWNGFDISDDDFASLDSSGVRNPRNEKGELPDLPFLHLAIGSPFVDAGTNVGIEYLGIAPDLGAFEGPRDPVSSNLDFYIPLDSIQDDFLRFYPNPLTHGKAILEYTLDTSADLVISLADMYGRSIKTDNLGYQYQGIYRYEFSVEGIPDGAYLLMIHNGKSCKTVKIIISTK